MSGLEQQETTGSKACFEPVWSVWRQDENGNYFLVKGGLTKADALSLVREYEQKGHKQLYWAEKSDRAPDRVVGG